MRDTHYALDSIDYPHRVSMSASNLDRSDGAVRVRQRYGINSQDDPL